MNKHIYLGLSILMSIVMNEYKYEWIWMEWIFKYEYVIVWICKTKILWKSKTLLYGYWQVHCPHKNRLYLQTHCRRCRARFGISICELNRPLPKEKNKKVTGVMKDGLRGKILKAFVELRAKTYRYLIDDCSKAKGTKKWVIKGKLKLEDYKNSLQATQLENKINTKNQEKNKIGVDSLKEDHKEFIKHYEVIVKAQQRFRSEKHVFTEEINRIALSSNDGKRMQSISSIETYTYGMSNDLVCKKEEIKCNNK